jgi:hypothetical protein
MGRHLLEQGDNIDIPGFSSPGTGNLSITFDETGTNGLTLDFLVLHGTTPVNIDSTGATGGDNFFSQLEETNNSLTKVTISGSEAFVFGGGIPSNAGDSVVTDIAATATSPKTIHSSLTLIDASATTGELEIWAGATNTSSTGNFRNGGSLNANVTITYTGLTIKGGSGSDFIDNDAKNGIIIDGNGNGDKVILGGAGAKATLGAGSSDFVLVGSSGLNGLGTHQAAGSGLGDSIKFGAAATAELLVGTGAEAGSTAGTGSIGLTKVLHAADGMQIDFTSVTSSSNILDATGIFPLASAKNLTTAENDAVAMLPGAGVVYFTFQGNEYFIATNNNEVAISADDAIVKLVGVTDIHHATNAGGLVTLHV